MDWDDLDDRRIVLAGPRAVADRLELDRLRTGPVTALFDELHKFRGCKSFLKGFFDVYADRVKILVTGSSRLDVYRRGGESLMGRYFLYRMHPFSVGEIARQDVPKDAVRPPTPVPDKEFAALWEHGGFPEPFLRREQRFTTRWRSLRDHQLFREEFRDLTRIHELAQLEVLGRLIEERSGTSLVYSNLAQEIQVSVDTARRWIAALSSLHHCFLVRPWFRNVAKALRKEPKLYLRDWSAVSDPGARAETFAACHLLKAVETWTDLGLGEFELRYVRDKEKREVDFLVVRDRRPWFLVEVKKGAKELSPSLPHFQAATGALHALQVVFDLEFVNADCFERRTPTVVPARTFFSQLP